MNKPNGIAMRYEETAMRGYTQIYVDGAWVEPLEGKIIDIINPATEISWPNHFVHQRPCLSCRIGST